MAREIERLKALQISRAKEPGLRHDGGGLYLQVGPSGSKSWVFRFMLRGHAREMGLGSVNAFTLAQARERAQAARQLLTDGVDPIEARAATIQARAKAVAKSIQFKECAIAYVKAHKAGWSNSKHAAQWTATLDTYANPVIGRLNVADVDTGMVMQVLEPIWQTKPETASRVRGRIESILNWATTRGYRTGLNPSRWRGHLDNLLPAPTKVRKVKHHAALPYRDMHAFIAELRKQEGTAAKALEFAISTAARTGEVIGATWAEFDLDAGTWTVPGARMKAGKEHRVPLNDAALAILQHMHKLPDRSDFVFPGQRRGQALSNMAMLALIKRMGRSDLTAHGFRSSFCDWAAEATHYPREIVEMALAHAIGDKTEEAYRRGDLFERRRELMQDWQRYCETSRTAKIVPMRRNTSRQPTSSQQER